MTNLDLDKKIKTTHVPTANDKLLAMFAHILPIFTAFIGPLLIWLLKKDDSPFIEEHSKNALNFQLSLLIYLLVSWILVLIIIGAFLIPIISTLNIIFCVIGGAKASNGSAFIYPFTIPFIK